MFLRFPKYRSFLKIIKVGYLECNCYIIEKNNKVLIVDPGDEYDKIKPNLKSKKVLAILNTHNHFDHIGCIKDIVRDYNVEVYSFDNLEEKEYKIGPFIFEVIFNPGHSSDSVSYYFKKDNILFCGDFIFYHNIGRWDLPTGNMREMLNSINEIKKLPKNTIIYPGHGIETSLEEEIQNNYYFK